MIGKVAWKERDNGASKSWYSYDEQGRIVSYVQKVPGLTGNKTIDYTYGTNGQVSGITYQKGNTNEYFYHGYTYDADARLKSVSTTNTYNTQGLPTNLVKQADYTYYLHGPLKSVNLADGLQQIDYTYTIQGWLKAINNPNSLGTDAFAEQLEYFSGDYTNNGVVKNTTNTGTDRFDGLPRAQTWRTNRPPAGIAQMSTPEAFVYSYSKQYQFTKADWGTVSAKAFVAPAITNAYVEGNITYDKNGNMQALQRYTKQGGVPQHNFTYNYTANTNKLESLSGTSYSYDETGRMISQDGLDSKIYAYNVSGLITAVSTAPTQGVSSKPIFTYTYDQNNQLIRKDFYDIVKNIIAHSLYYIRDANGSLLTTIATNDVTNYNILGADMFGNYNSRDKYKYLLKDHLGSTRAIAANTGVISCADYYPYGMKMADNVDNENTLPAQYQGQNSQYDNTNTLNINEFYWRQYDPVIARWSCPDPYGQFDSPYISMGNNPVINTDPDGGLSVSSIKMAYYSVIRSGAIGWTQYKIDSKIRHIKNYAEGVMDNLENIAERKIHLSNLIARYNLYKGIYDDAYKLYDKMNKLNTLMERGGTHSWQMTLGPTVTNYQFYQFKKDSSVLDILPFIPVDGFK